MNLAKVSESLVARFGDTITDRGAFREELTLSVRPETIHEICEFCRDELSFDLLLDISSVDHFEQEPRFEIVYELYSLSHRIHLRLKTPAAEDDPAIRTVSDIWPTANWHEREIWDMMGIRFDGHLDLRRILMWEGYPYHPLRKDFPLEGKISDVPDVAFTEPAPLAGGPFVTVPVAGSANVREPRARHAGDPAPEAAFTAEL